MDAMNRIEDHACEVQSRQLRLADIASAAPMLPADASVKHHIGYQLFGLSFHHALSVVSHLQRHGPQLAASAFALARPMFETLQRGWWFTLCATEFQASAFLQSDHFPIRNLLDVSRAIERHAPFLGTDFFSGFGQEELDAYHSFTHGGMQAMAAYANRPQFDPEFDPARDVPPLLSSTPIWSPIPRSKEIGREEALFRRTDHWFPA